MHFNGKARVVEITESGEISLLKMNMGQVDYVTKINA